MSGADGASRLFHIVAYFLEIGAKNCEKDAKKQRKFGNFEIDFSTLKRTLPIELKFLEMLKGLSANNDF